MSLFVHTLHKRGMILNCKSGKSAIMISKSGQNSKAAPRWLDQLEGFLTITGCRFQIVRSYKLLGGMIDAQGSLGPEIHSRQIAVSKISGPFHKYIITNLPLAQSVTCVNSMIVSSRFNAHTWCAMSVAQLEQINSRLANTNGSCIP